MLVHIHIPKANDSCFSLPCFAVLPHCYYLKAREHLTVGEAFLNILNTDSKLLFLCFPAFSPQCYCTEEELGSCSAPRSPLYHPVRKLFLQQMSASMKGRGALTCLEQSGCSLSGSQSLSMHPSSHPNYPGKNNPLLAASS